MSVDPTVDRLLRPFPTQIGPESFQELSDQLPCLHGNLFEGRIFTRYCLEVNTRARKRQSHSHQLSKRERERNEHLSWGELMWWIRSSQVYVLNQHLSSLVARCSNCCFWHAILLVMRTLENAIALRFFFLVREYFILEWYMSTRICENAFKTTSCFRRIGRTVESTFFFYPSPQSEWFKECLLFVCITLHKAKTDPRDYMSSHY